MAHNQDRLQNSDSSVVYGHGHIIYDREVAGDVGDTPLRQAIKQPTMSLNGPLQKHISLPAKLRLQEKRHTVKLKSYFFKFRVYCRKVFGYQSIAFELGYQISYSY